MKNIKKFLACGLAVCMMVTALPMMGEKVTGKQSSHVEGVSGDLKWEIDENGLLTITGNGNYERNKTEGGDYSTPPIPNWCTYSAAIKKAKVNVTNLTSTQSMFAGCEILQEVDLSGLDTSNVTDMSYMFAQCSELKHLDLKQLKTGKVTNMSAMFMGCGFIDTFKGQKMDTKNVTDMSHMFEEAAGYSNLGYSFDGWCFDTKNVTNMSYMFRGSGFDQIDLTSFDTSQVTNMQWMFAESCVKSLNLSNLKVEQVTDMHSLFNNCENLKTLDLSSWSIGRNVLFHEWGLTVGCKSLETLKTPKRTATRICLGGYWKDRKNNAYEFIEPRQKSVTLTNTFLMDDEVLLRDVKKLKKGKVKVSWWGLKNVTGYKIVIKSGKKVKKVTVKGAAKKTAVIQLKKNKKYVIRVFAYIGKKGKIYLGKKSNYRKVTV